LTRWLVFEWQLDALVLVGELNRLRYFMSAHQHVIR